MILNDVLKTPGEYSSNRVIGLSRGPATRYDSNAHCESTGGNPVQRTITENERTNRKNIVAKIDTSSGAERATFRSNCIER